MSLSKTTLTCKYAVFLVAFVFQVFLSLVMTVPQGLSAVSTGTTVLIYHRFGEEQYPTTNVSLEKFKEQMAWLKDNNYKVIPLARLVECLHENRKLPERSVVITIDDGYRSTYTEAWPILREYGYPFTVFIYVRATEQGYGNILTWEEIKEMKNDGVLFQSHSWSHPYFVERTRGMTEKEYRKWIRTDLEKGSEIMEQRLGERPEYLTLPYGVYNSTVLEEGRNLGYKAILTQDPGSVSRHTSPYFIPRDAILGDEWSTLDHFQKVLERVDLPVKTKIPAPEPGLPMVIEKFGARLVHPERYLPGTLGVYVTGMGWRQAEREGDLVYIGNDKPLTRGVSRITVSGREKESGRIAQHAWMILGPE